MSEREKTAEGYQKLKNLTPNEIGNILVKTGFVKNPAQLTSVDFFLLGQGKYTKTLLDLKPTEFSKDLHDFLDNTKGKIKLKVLDDGNVVSGVRYRCNELKIPDVYAQCSLSESDKKELSENGYLKNRVSLKSEKGDVYDAFLSVDKDMNSIVAMPISRLNIAPNALGPNNPLTEDQLKSLRNGYSVAYFGFVDKQGNKVNKTIGIDRINGIIQTYAMKSGLESAQKMEQSNQSQKVSEDLGKKKSKGKGV